MEHKTAAGEPLDTFTNDAWVEVFKTVDRTYTELVEHQVELEKRNAEQEGMLAFLTSVLGAMSDVLIVCGPEGHVLEVNDAFERHSGLARNKATGTMFHDLFAEKARNAVRRAFVDLRNGRTVPHAERLVRARRVICDRVEATVGRACQYMEQQGFDLTKWLSSASVEKQVQGFVADFLLEGEGETLLIEVVVTHPCTQEKIDSGLKIIETRVESEADIAQLRNGFWIDGRRQSDTIFGHRLTGKPRIARSANRSPRRSLYTSLRRSSSSGTQRTNWPAQCDGKASCTRKP